LSQANLSSQRRHAVARGIRAGPSSPADLTLTIVGDERSRAFVVTGPESPSTRTFLAPPCSSFSADATLLVQTDAE